MSLEQAIKILKEKYEYACRQSWVHDPVAWALYETWREVDRRRGS